ncbi:hypothetical protein J3F84DRAFT_363745 [Trichoderma pleuroticola]
MYLRMHVPVCASGQVRHSWRPPEWDRDNERRRKGSMGMGQNRRVGDEEFQGAGMGSVVLVSCHFVAACIWCFFAVWKLAWGREEGGICMCCPTRKGCGARSMYVQYRLIFGSIIFFFFGVMHVTIHEMKIGRLTLTWRLSREKVREGVSLSSCE